MTAEQDAFAEEAAARWGNTTSYAESQRRLKKYSDADIKLAKADMEYATQLILVAYQAGLPASSGAAIHGAQSHRGAISQWWYPCNYEMHCQLAQMYLADPRFTANYENYAVGFAQYVHDAIHASA